MAVSTADPKPSQPRIGPNDILRFILEIFAFVSLGIWGFTAFPLPWPGVLEILTWPPDCLTKP